MKAKKLFKETIIYGGADFVGKFIAFITFPIIAATLGPEEFGYLDLILTVTTLSGILISCGLNGAINRFYWDENTPEKDRSLIISNGLFVLCGFAALLVGLACFVIPVIFQETRSLPFGYQALLGATILTITAQLIRYSLDVIRLQFAPFKFMTIALFVKIISAALAVYVVVYLSKGIDGLLIIRALVGVAAIPLIFFFIKKDLVFKFDTQWTKKLLAYGYPLIFANIAFWLFSAIDRWMLAYFSSVAETGIYSLAFRLSTIILFISLALGRAWSPYAIKLKTENPAYKEIYVNVFLFLIYIMLVAAGTLALFSGEFITLLLPDSYASSAIPLTILCFSIIFQATQQITIIGITIEKKTHLQAKIVWFAAFANFTLNFFLIPTFGATGAAIATLLSYFILTGSYFYFTQRLHRLPFDKKKIICFIIAGITLLITSIIGYNNEIMWHFIMVKIIIGFLIFGLSAWLLPFKQLQNLLNK